MKYNTMNREQNPCMLLSFFFLENSKMKNIYTYIYICKQLVAKATLHFLVLVYIDLVGGLEHVLFFSIYWE